MSNQQHSSSLEVVEANQQIIQISQNSFQIQTNNQQRFIQSLNHQDTFQLSLDENSLSFCIQQPNTHKQCKNVLKEENQNTQLHKLKHLPVKPEELKPFPNPQQQRKRKRKQIFQKYKQKSTQNLITGPDLQLNTGNLMNTFDEIFKIKSPEKKQIMNLSPYKKQSQKTQIPKINAFKKKQSNSDVPDTSFEEIPTILSKNYIQNTNDTKIMKKGLNRGSDAFFHIPSIISQHETIDLDSNVLIGSTNSFLIQSQANRISIIVSHSSEQQFSRDSVDLQTLLKSQIFREQKLYETIRKQDDSYKNIQISTTNPSIMLKNQDQSDIITNFDIQQRFGMTRDKSQAVLTSNQNYLPLKRSLSDRKIQLLQPTIPQKTNLVKFKPLNEIENRIPVYLRQIRKRNTVIPNFYMKHKNHTFFIEQNTIFKELLTQFKKALNLLDFVNEKVFERHSHIKKAQNQLMNSLTVETFATCGWEKVFEIKQLSYLKPHESFIRRKYEYEKVKGALHNYLSIAEYYQKGNLNLQDPKAQKKYLQIRSKFWQIEKNIKMIGEDIYLVAIETAFPTHYYQFLKVLKGQFCRSERPIVKIQAAQNLLASYYMLKNQGDTVCLSQIGKYAAYNLQRMIQRSFLI